MILFTFIFYSPILTPQTLGLPLRLICRRPRWHPSRSIWHKLSYVRPSEPHTGRRILLQLAGQQGPLWDTAGDNQSDWRAAYCIKTVCCMRMYIFWFVREGTRTEWDIIYYELVMTGSSFMQLHSTNTIPTPPTVLPCSCRCSPLSSKQSAAARRRHSWS